MLLADPRGTALSHGDPDGFTTDPNNMGLKKQFPENQYWLTDGSATFQIDVWLR